MTIQSTLYRSTVLAAMMAVVLAGCATPPEPTPTHDHNAISPLASVCRHSPQYCDAITSDEWERKYRPFDTFKPSDAPRRP